MASIVTITKLNKKEIDNLTDLGKSENCRKEKMGKALQFTLTILVIYIFEIGSALWVTTIIGNKITELFNQLIEVLSL